MKSLYFFNAIATTEKDLLEIKEKLFAAAEIKEIEQNFDVSPKSIYCAYF